VPFTASLAYIKLDHAFMRTHILRRGGGDDAASGGVGGGRNGSVFATLSGASVARRDGRVHTLAGFARPRAPAVTYEETYYSDDFDAFNVCRVNYPLIGKLPLSYVRSVVATQRARCG
jgi:hypothetical protein